MENKRLEGDRAGVTGHVHRLLGTWQEGERCEIERCFRFSSLNAGRVKREYVRIHAEIPHLLSRFEGSQIWQIQRVFAPIGAEF